MKSCPSPDGPLLMAPGFDRQNFGPSKKRRTEEDGIRLLVSTDSTPSIGRDLVIERLLNRQNFLFVEACNMQAPTCRHEIVDCP